MHHWIILLLIIIILLLVLKRNKTSASCFECYNEKDPVKQYDCEIQNCTTYYDSYNRN